MTAAFLPYLTEPRGFEYRPVDLRRPVDDWLGGLASPLTTGLFYGGAAIWIAVRRRGPIAVGILLGLSLKGAIGTLFSDLASSPEFRPGIGLWLTLAAELAAACAGLIGLSLRPLETAIPPPPPPPGDWTTA